MSFLLGILFLAISLVFIVACTVNIRPFILQRRLQKLESIPLSELDAERIGKVLCFEGYASADAPIPAYEGDRMLIYSRILAVETSKDAFRLAFEEERLPESLTVEDRGRRCQVDIPNGLRVETAGLGLPNTQANEIDIRPEQLPDSLRKRIAQSLIWEKGTFDLIAHEIRNGAHLKFKALVLSLEPSIKVQLLDLWLHKEGLWNTKAGRSLLKSAIGLALSAAASGFCIWWSEVI